VLVLLGALTKSAQFPFHFWLPHAMAAPTPVSAYLHSATMVKAGVYLVARMTPILGATYGWTAVVSIVGAATMVVGACRAVQETDLKRILAYSTVSALGVLTMLLGVGTREAITAALVYLLAHACYKGALFLVAGSIDHEAGTRDVTVLSGLRRAMPVTALAGGAAALSMAGLPLTLGFVGKDGAYEAFLHGGDRSIWFLGLTVLASMLLGLSGLLVGLVPFRGHAVTADEAHEPPWELWLPALVLATAGVITGIAPFILDDVVGAAATAITGVPVDASLAVWHGFTPALALSMATLAGVGGAYACRNVLRVSTWQPRVGPEQIYGGVLRALDATGRAIAPALHSASLRSYVMAIVVTTIFVVGVAVATTPGIPGLRQHTPVRTHELLVVLVVIAGAVAAATARSTMAAVLSLGAVGYGVAMTFLLFGAPDLAMTQFSVETLTAVIYVLVFRRFRTLENLSPPLVRMRDGLLATSLGVVVGGLVLVTAHAETAPRLREFFVEYGPTLGHGRNIVNVILVDFRGFDTLGEITVLATAAIGVRALVRLAAAERTATASDVASSLSTSAIFRSATRALMPLLLLFALFLLMRGHNQPGGGFVGGLVAAAAFALYAIAFGVEQARRALLVNPLVLLGSGLLIAAASGLPAVIGGRSFLSAVWVSWPAALGTPVVFDIGVFLVVTGVVAMMIFSLAEEA
jgi:multicomponent Na+:H+ antiporter subunit A